MMAHELVSALQARGIVLVARADRLLVDAPAGTLTAADRAELMARKPELLAVLADRPAAPAAPLWWEGPPWYGQITDDEHCAVIAKYIAHHSYYQPDLPLREPAVLDAWRAARRRCQ